MHDRLADTPRMVIRPSRGDDKRSTTRVRQVGSKLSGCPVESAENEDQVRLQDVPGLRIDQVQVDGIVIHRRRSHQCAEELCPG